MLECLKEINKKTVSLLERANSQLKEEDKFFYDGEFYSGSLNPEIFIIGLNPGFDCEEWKDRKINSEKLSREYEAKEIKYIAEKKDGCKLAKQIYKLFEQYVFNDSTKAEDFISTKLAETNFIHFATPDSGIYKNLLAKIDQALQKELQDHFVNSLHEVLEHITPKLIFVIGKGTRDKLRNSEIIDQDCESVKNDEKNRFSYCKSNLNSVPLLTVKHLSGSVSNKQFEEYGKIIQEYIK